MAEAEYIPPGEGPMFGDIPDEEVEERVTAAAQAYRPPFPITIVGFDLEPDDKGKRQRHEHVFHARGEAPKGQVFNVVRLMNARGELQLGAAMQFIHIALVEEDRERWVDTLDDPAIFYDDPVFGDVCAYILEKYAERPSAPRSARRAGPRRVGRTSTAVHSGRVSTSTRSK